MGFFSTDLRGTKQQCYELIDAMNEEFGVIADSKRIQRLMTLTAIFPVEHYKLAALLKSQLMSGHKAGAKKVIQALPDVCYALWVQVCLWPFIVVIRLAGAIVGLLRPVGRWGRL